jgi:hypothetical protein
MAEKWSITGDAIAACNCDAGCPCNFGSPPTQGYCQTAYLLVVNEGHYGETRLDGLMMVVAVSWPGPIWEGNATSILVCDERMTPEQRAAVEVLLHGGGGGMPFDALAAMTSEWRPTITAPFEVHLDGVRTRAQVGAGSIYDLAGAKIKHPISGVEVDLDLGGTLFGLGTSRSAIGTSVVARLNAGDLVFENSSKHVQYLAMNWTGG